MNTTARPAACWASTRWRLHVPHTKQDGCPFGNAIVAPPAANVVRALITGSSGTPSRSSAGADEEAEPVADDLDRDARRLGSPDERNEAGIVRLAGRRRQEVRAVRPDQAHLPLHEPARPDQALVVAGGAFLPGRDRRARP